MVASERLFAGAAAASRGRAGIATQLMLRAQVIGMMKFSQRLLASPVRAGATSGEKYCGTPCRSIWSAWLDTVVLVAPF